MAKRKGFLLETCKVKFMQACLLGCPVISRVDIEGNIVSNLSGEISGTCKQMIGQKLGQARESGGVIRGTKERGAAREWHNSTGTAARARGELVGVRAHDVSLQQIDRSNAAACACVAGGCGIPGWLLARKVRDGQNVNRTVLAQSMFGAGGHAESIAL